MWSEVFLARFQVPTVGTADLVGTYMEAKYKFTTHLWGSARINVMMFGDVSDGEGGQARWDNNTWRMDLSTGWRFNKHWQLKLQYSYGEEQSPGIEGNNLFAVQITLRF